MEKPVHVHKKGKKFPWLIVALVTVAGGAALYFLVLKKTKYELTVTLGAGTTGTPATSKYKKGEVVAYSFSAQAGYGNLQVMLDGSLVAASGSVTMDKAHAITTSAAQGAFLQVNSTPSGAHIYLDSVDSGFVTPHAFSFPTAVTKNVRLHSASCGYIDHSQTVSINFGQTITINATLATGIHEDFNEPASSCWLPNSPSSWSTDLGGGHYKYEGNDAWCFMNFYNFPFSGNYTLTVKMNLVWGHGKNAGLFLGTSTSATNANGYHFFYGDGYEFDLYGIHRLSGQDFTNPVAGSTTVIKTGSSSAIKVGFNKWNILKIAKVGTNYTFYINNVVIHSFNDAVYTPTYCALIASTGGDSTRMLYDYVYLTQ